MSENDIIAQYIRDKYPEMLGTTDFAFYKMGFALRNFAINFTEAFKKIDFEKLKEAAEKVNSTGKE